MSYRRRIFAIIAVVVLTDACIFVWLLPRLLHKPTPQGTSSPAKPAEPTSSPPTQPVSSSAVPSNGSTHSPSRGLSNGSSRDRLPSWVIPYGAEPWKTKANAKDSPASTHPHSVASGGAKGNGNAAGAADPSLAFSNAQLSGWMERVSSAFRTDPLNPRGPTEARGHGYRAKLEEGMVQLTLQSPESGASPSDANGGTSALGSDVQARLRTSSVRRSTSNDEASKALAPLTNQDWIQQGNTIQALRDEVSGWVEHYEARGSGLEITWYFPKPLPGSGGLWVDLEVSGLRATGPSGGGVHFADDLGTPRMRVGQGYVVDAAGRQETVAPLWVEGAVRYEISAAFLESASYPIALDPVVSPEFGIDRPVFTNAYEAQGSPAIAWGGNSYLAVWKDQRREDLPFILGTRVSNQGVVLDPGGLVLCSVAGYQDAPTVAGRNGQFLVAWTDYRDGVGEIYGARVKEDGTLSDPTGVPLVAAPRLQDTPALAVQGDHFLLVWADYRNDTDFTNPDIYGERISTNGTVMGAGAFPICVQAKGQYEPRLAVSGTTALVAWTDLRSGGAVDQADVYGGRVDNAGVVLDGSGFLISSQKQLRGSGSDPVPHAQHLPAVAASTNRFLVVWQDERNGTDSDVYGTLVSLDGHVLQTNGIPISTLPDLQAHPAVASDGSGFLAVWEDRRNGGQDLFGARINGLGTVLDPAGIPISLAEVNQSLPSLAFGNGVYLAAWEDTRGGLFSDIYGARIATTGERIDPDGFLISSAENQQHLPSVGWNGKVYLVAWRDYRRPGAFDLYGARVTTGGTVLDPEGIYISSRASFNSYPGIGASGTDFLLAWEYQARGLDHDLYGRRVSTDGVVLDADDIPIAVAPGEQYRASVAGTGTGWLVAWGDNRVDEDYDIYGQLVGQDGKLIGTSSGFPICAQPELQFTVRLAWNGSQFLAVWRDSRNSPSSDPDFANRICDIYGRLISPTGQLVGSADIPICTELIHNQRFPTVATDGQGFFVVWEDRRDGDLDVYGSLVSGSGVVGTPNGFPICAVSGNQTIPVVSWDGEGYWVAWKDDRSGTADVYGRQVSATGALLGGDSGIPLATGSQDQILPWVMSANPDSTLLVYQTKLSDLVGRVGARVLQSQSAQPPSFVSTPSLTAVIGSTYTYSAAAQDPDSSLPKLSPMRLPAWLSWVDLGQGTGRLIGQPSAGDIGTNRVILTATDGRLQVAQVFDIVVTQGTGNSVQIRVQSIRATGGGNELCWDSVAGNSYRVEFKEPVDAPGWTLLSTVQATTSSTCSLDPSPGSSTRFYRVMEQR